MTRQFSFGTVFRMTDKTVLRSFFNFFSADTADVPWDKLRRNDIDIVQKFFDELPQDKRNEAEIILRHAHALACERGMEALGEAADELRADETWAGVYLSDKNLYTKALSAWITHREIFEHAIRYYEIDSLSWWRKRTDLPKTVPQFDEEIKEQLETGLEQFFKTKQGRGFVCTVEMTERANGVYYFFAYPDDFADDALVHDTEGNLVAKTIRKTFEIVFAYDSIEGTSDLSAKVSDKLRNELEALFLDRLFSVTPEENSKAPYNLAMMLNPDFTLQTRHEHHVKAQVVSLTLAWADKDEVVFISKKNRTAREMAMGSVKINQPIQKAEVKRVKFRFEFYNPETGKIKTLTFEVGTPNSCTLRNQQPELVEIIEYYLKQWRIEDEQSSECEPARGDALQLAAA